MRRQKKSYQLPRRRKLHLKDNNKPLYIGTAASYSTWTSRADISILVILVPAVSPFFSLWVSGSNYPVYFLLSCHPVSILGSHLCEELFPFIPRGSAGKYDDPVVSLECHTADPAWQPASWEPRRDTFRLGSRRSSCLRLTELFCCRLRFPLRGIEDVGSEGWCKDSTIQIFLPITNDGDSATNLWVVCPVTFPQRHEGM